MAIFGLTVSDTGEALQRLAVTTKVAIGEVVTVQGKNGTTTRPNKLDHFVFLRKNATSFEWEPDPELLKHYNTNCREFWVVLLDDGIENVFRTEYAWWSKTEKKCWGDGRAATRRTEKNPDGEDWKPCGDGCPELEGGLCKPSGDLYFVLADFPRLGSVCRLHTSSYRSIRQIHSALQQIQTVTGGRLAGIRCKLVVRPEKAAYVDAKTNTKKTTTIYALNLELSADDMRKLLSKMTQYASLFEQTRKQLGDGRKVVYLPENEPEKDRAPDIAQEFYPGEEQPEAHPEVRQPERASREEKTVTVPKADIPDLPTNGGNGKSHAMLVTKQQRMDLFKIITEQGWSNTQVKEILNEEFGFSESKEITQDKYALVCSRFSRTDPTELEFPDGDVPI